MRAVSVKMGEGDAARADQRDGVASLRVGRLLGQVRRCHFDGRFGDKCVIVAAGHGYTISGRVRPACALANAVSTIL